MLLLALGAWLISTRHGDNDRIHELEAQVTALKRQGLSSELDRSVSEQMEIIAHGQQALSEERSQEAIRQSAIAKAATIRSEAERQKALKAQAEAETSAAEALASYQMAERQRLNAEHARMVTDTLNYISLGRTLGSLSYSIYQTGNTELGNMLAYASYLYTHDYGGNLLTQSAGARLSRNSHNGNITRLYLSPHDGRLFSVSTFGELFFHKVKEGELQTTSLLNDKQYWFCDVFVAPMGKVYALSCTGHLVITDGRQTHVVNLETVSKPFGLQALNDGKRLLIVGEESVALFDVATDKVIASRRLNFRATSIGRRDDKPLLFDNRGNMHLVNSLDNMTTEKKILQLMAWPTVRSGWSMEWARLTSL